MLKCMKQSKEKVFHDKVYDASDRHTHRQKNLHLPRGKGRGFGTLQTDRLLWNCPLAMGEDIPFRGLCHLLQHLIRRMMS